MKKEEFKKAYKKLIESKDLVSDGLKDWWANYLLTNEERYTFTYDLISKYETGSDGKILEVGSIPCHLTILLSQMGIEVHGVDLNPGRLEQLITHHDILVKRANIESEDLPFDDNEFNLILFTEVIEHLRIDPFRALKEMFRVLKKDGILLLSTPNVTLLNKINFLRGIPYQGDIISEFEKLEKIGHMGHFRIYDKNELIEMLQFIGFAPLNVSYFGKPEQSKLNWLLPLVTEKESLKPIIFVEAQKRNIKKGS